MKTLWGPVVVGMLAGAAGCAAMRRVDSSPLAPSPQPYDPDIPLPLGFRLADQSQEQRPRGSVRYLRHLYRGKGTQEKVRSFYLTQMPLVRWTPVSENLVNGRIALRFTRGREVCMVTIGANPRWSPHEVAVEVRLWRLAPRAW